MALEGTLGMTPPTDDGVLSRDHAHVTLSEDGAAISRTRTGEYDPAPNSASQNLVLSS